jgi:hypothetical protein
LVTGGPGAWGYRRASGLLLLLWLLLWLLLLWPLVCL